MRMIGHVRSQPEAQTFGDYLLAQGIESRVESDGEQGWAVWILEEDKIDPSIQALAGFRANPRDPKFHSAAGEAEKLRDQARQDQEAYERRMKNRRHLFRPLTEYGFGVVSFILIAISVGVFLMSHMSEDMEKVAPLFMTDFFSNTDWRSLAEVRSGQVWRLLTPIFIHFGIMHLFFNMLWLRDLGSMIEGRQSPWTLVVLVLAIGIGSNLAEFVFGSSPMFGGMSGVVYGLLGYIWIRGKRDPGSGLFLHPTTVTMMLVWFVLCWSGVIGHIANYAHTGGLIMGMAWGFISSLPHR